MLYKRTAILKQGFKSNKKPNCKETTMTGLPSEFLRGYRIFGLLLVLALILSTAGYFFLRATPRERSVKLAGVAVPVPDGMKKVSETPNSARDQGKIALKGNVSASMITRFYYRVMPANDWLPDASLGAAEGGYAFTRGRQKLIIKIDEREPDKSILTIVVHAGEAPILTG